MGRLLTSIVIGVMLCGMAFAQENLSDIRSNSSKEALWQKVDATTEWGKWMVDVFKPYFEKMSEAAVTTILPMMEIDPAGLSREELIKKANAGFVDYYKAIQIITPPEELKAYHAKILESYAGISKSIPANQQQALELETATKKLNDEAMQEITSVFTSHGVPQDIIVEFMKGS